MTHPSIHPSVCPSVRLTEEGPTYLIPVMSLTWKSTYSLDFFLLVLEPENKRAISLFPLSLSPSSLLVFPFRLLPTLAPRGRSVKSLMSLAHSLNSFLFGKELQKALIIPPLKHEREKKGTIKC